MENETMYLDQAGYQKIVEQIAELKLKLAEVMLQRGAVFKAGLGDAWHDNVEFDEVKMKERRIRAQLKEYEETLKKVVIVEEHNDANSIDVGDIVTINMIFGPDDIDELQFRLVGYVSEFNNDNSNLTLVSINSPLGNAVYHRQIGEKNSYEVDGRTFNIEIVSKTNDNNYTR